MAALAILSMRQSLMRFVPGMSLDPSILAVAFVLMLGPGLAAGLVPAVNAFRLKVADAMGR